MTTPTTPRRTVPAHWPTTTRPVLVVRADHASGLEALLPVLREDDYDVDGSPSPLRVYDQQLLTDIGDAIRRHPGTDAPGWGAPTAVLALVERYLLASLLPGEPLE